MFKVGTFKNVVIGAVLGLGIYQAGRTIGYFHGVIGGYAAAKAGENSSEEKETEE